MFGFFSSLITPHLIFVTRHLSLITYHLKYPNSLLPTHLALSLSYAFNQKTKKNGTHTVTQCHFLFSPFFFLFPLTLIFLCHSSLFSLPLAQCFFHLFVLSSLPSLGGNGNGEGGNTATTTKTTATTTTATKPPFQPQPTVITKLTNKQKKPNHHHSHHPTTTTTITTTTTATKPTEKKKKLNTKAPQ